MQDLTELLAEAEAQTDVVAAVAEMVNRIADQLEEALASGDQGAIDAVVAQLRSNDETLGQLVAKNTPGAPSEPEPTEPAEPVTPDEPDSSGTPDGF